MPTKIEAPPGNGKKAIERTKKNAAIDKAAIAAEARRELDQQAYSDALARSSDRHADLTNIAGQMQPPQGQAVPGYLGGIDPRLIGYADRPNLPNSILNRTFGNKMADMGTAFGQALGIVDPGMSAVELREATDTSNLARQRAISERFNQFAAMHGLVSNAGSDYATMRREGSAYNRNMAQENLVRAQMEQLKKEMDPVTKLALSGLSEDIGSFRKEILAIQKDNTLSPEERGLKINALRRDRNELNEKMGRTITAYQEWQAGPQDKPFPAADYIYSGGFIKNPPIPGSLEQQAAELVKKEFLEQRGIHIYDVMNDPNPEVLAMYKEVLADLQQHGVEQAAAADSASRADSDDLIKRMSAAGPPDQLGSPNQPGAFDVPNTQVQSGFTDEGADARDHPLAAPRDRRSGRRNASTEDIFQGAAPLQRAEWGKLPGVPGLVEWWKSFDDSTPELLRRNRQGGRQGIRR